jgi:hypothetical protein
MIQYTFNFLYYLMDLKYLACGRSSGNINYISADGKGERRGGEERAEER